MLLHNFSVKYFRLTSFLVCDNSLGKAKAIRDGKEQQKETKVAESRNEATVATSWRREKRRRRWWEETLPSWDRWGNLQEVRNNTPITNVIILVNWREFRRRLQKGHRKISQCQCRPQGNQSQMRKSLTLRSTLKTERNISRALEMQTKIHTRTNSSVLTELMSSERNLMEHAKRMEPSKMMSLFN